MKEEKVRQHIQEIDDQVESSKIFYLLLSSVNQTFYSESYLTQNPLQKMLFFMQKSYFYHQFCTNELKSLVVKTKYNVFQCPEQPNLYSIHHEEMTFFSTAEILQIMNPRIVSEVFSTYRMYFEPSTPQEEIYIQHSIGGPLLFLEVLSEFQVFPVDFVMHMNLFVKCESIE